MATEAPRLQSMKAEYLLYDDLNVVVVDWLSGSGPPYTQAVANIRLIGAIIGRLVLDLEEYFGVPPSAVHLVGHSLGAQLGGYTGEYLKGRGAKLGRITGLDPAEPYFEGTDPVVRLDPLDATLVDVIHTDAGPIITGGMLGSRVCLRPVGVACGSGVCLRPVGPVVSELRLGRA
ncbi:putative pancreatic triacylglycerol lipase-like [Penaeus vannamei]|uniref:Putative pancreatic triacylglycerol lipase-like n=1 Tax=Penaeus vannamei TaxID=6689 RepID=A0A3R7MI90_PENVA|nr:putative pancreatic triacylglycerol lipase-like [Penaeus vannamei]